jgi:glutamine synthetase
MSERSNPTNISWTIKSIFELDQGSSIIAEYIWIDGSGQTMRSKAKVMKSKVKSLDDLSDWAYDGSSTWQAETASTSEVTLKPVAYFKDPFRGGDNVLVLCDTYVKKSKDSEELVPANTNFRYHAKKIFDAAKD